MSGGRDGSSPAGESGVRRLTPGVLLRSFLRAFTIQGSWNYRSMLGNGFAFALLPVLKRLYRDQELADAVRRHAEHFNAHPYLANIALGAAARMEAEGRDDVAVRRFKQAVSGPLGGLGDTLVWATLLPTTMLAALVLAWAGASPWLAVLTFLLSYNAGHLVLRVWAFRTGLREGQEVGTRLRRAGLGGRTEQLARLGSLLLGAFVGLVLMDDPGLGDPRWIGAILGAGAVLLGLLGGHRIWRPTAFAVVGMIVALSATQMIL